MLHEFKYVIGLSFSLIKHVLIKLIPSAFSQAQLTVCSESLFSACIHFEDKLRL